MITKLNIKDQSIKSYAIRKLTPKECFRLMGIDDDTIRVMQSTLGEAKERVKEWTSKCKDPNVTAISVSQQYKMAGNSIVVNVLRDIYENLWYPKPHQASNDSLFQEQLPAMPETVGIVGGKLFLTTFSCYDSQLLAADALKKLHPDFSWDCVGWSDIDKYACQMHNLIFPQFEDRALGDITKIDWQDVKRNLNDKEIDLLTYSSPCQDISQAGKQMGLKAGSGTRSALLWNVRDAVETLRPKYLLQENVAALVSKKFMPDFQKWLDSLEHLGYINRWALINAKDHGVPQNRLRVFCLSMRKDVAFDYQFPEAVPLDRLLADVLEEEVAERFFLSDESIGKFLKTNDKDDAVFMQFNLPPTHEAAMFLKTFLQILIDTVNGWDMEPDELLSCIENGRCALDSDWKSFCDYHTFPCEGFAELFKENMERKQYAN